MESHKKFTEQKQVHVGMEASKTNRTETRWRKGYLLPTWARKTTCQSFHWMLQSWSGWKWKKCKQMLLFYSHALLRITFSSLMQQPTEKPLKVYKPDGNETTILSHHTLSTAGQHIFVCDTYTPLSLSCDIARFLSMCLSIVKQSLACKEPWV